jgi:hypothetical protein
MSDNAVHSTDRKTRVVTELKKFSAITLYLWCVFELFAIYRAMVLKEHGVDAWEQTFAIINALIFAKVIMTAQLLSLGRRLHELPIVYTALGNALVFATVIMLFHIAEEAIKAAVKGLPLSTALAEVGGGTFVGVLAVEAIYFVTLLPFFTGQELRAYWAQATGVTYFSHVTKKAIS